METQPVEFKIPDQPAPQSALRVFSWIARLRKPIAVPINPWLLLWATGIAGAWLLPTHMIPWGAFHSDMAMSMVLAPGALWIMLKSRRSATLGPTALAGFLVCLIPFAQYGLGLIYFSGDAWIAGTYLFGFGLAAMIGSRFEEVVPGELLNALSLSIVLAAIASTGLILYQWLGLSGLGMLALPFPKDARPYANLGQPNNAATLLVWGVLMVWRSYLTKKLSGWPSILVAILMMVGVVATQSRTGWLEVAFLAGAALVYRNRLRTEQYRFTIIAIAAFFILMVLGWSHINSALGLVTARTFSEEMAPGLRPAAWRLFLDALTIRPWVGWGWNQQSVAQIAVAFSHPSLRFTFASTHNLILDLLIQNGIPIGGLCSLALFWWIFKKAVAIKSVDGCIMLLTIGVLLIHSMLEFPQAYAYFLLPVGLIMGALDCQYPSRPVWQISRMAASALLICGIGIASAIAIEYNMAERSLERVRFERNRVGPSTNSKEPDLVVLTQLRGFLWYLRIKSYAGKISAGELEKMQAVAARFPSDGNQLVLAVAAASNGRPDLAHAALGRMCLMVPTARCEAALQNWRSMAANSSALAAVVVPESLTVHPSGG